MDNIAISEEAESEYLQYPNLCPYCSSSDISQEGCIEYHGKECYQQVECYDCSKIWVEVYKLVSIEPVYPQRNGD